MNCHFEKHLSTRDCKKHISFDFSVPAGCSSIYIELSFSPYTAGSINNMLTLTLFDPYSFRGAGHRSGDLHCIELSTISATPGYIPGLIPEGRWKAVIDCHMIMPGAPVKAVLDINFKYGSEKDCNDKSYTEISSAKNSMPGWYKGDFHVHTNHSDADITVADLAQIACDSALDFVFLTDHNTVSGLTPFKASATDSLLAAGGIELTTFYGHALCLGEHEWIDWRVSPGTGSMQSIAENCRSRGSVFVISHPQADGDPGCTGCSWRFGDMMPGNAQAVEIWNGSWDSNSNNESALLLWYDWLNQGIRISASAGTDGHDRNSYLPESGSGFNIVYARELSEASLLKSLCRGQLYLSSGPEITLEAQCSNGKIYGIGDTVTENSDFKVSWIKCPQDAVVRIIENGRLLCSLPAYKEGSYTWKTGPDRAEWTLMEIRDSRGSILAVTNPVFLKPAG